jgi:cobalt-zinc-cadmium efflux system outer membrane protein
MVLFRFVLLLGPLLATGCLYHAREKTDQTVLELAAHPFDLQPPQAVAPASQAKSGGEAGGGPAEKGPVAPAVCTDVQTTALLQPAVFDPQVEQAKQQPMLPQDIKDLRDRIKIPAPIPGSETPVIPKPPADEAGRLRAIRELYPPLPELPAEPLPLPGPNGQPYTLATLQQLAAANSPTLRQAAADVETARGNYIQAITYPNPTVGLEVDPSNDGSTAGVWGLFIDQPIKTFGKLRLAGAAAQMDLENAELALKRARSDLSTQVRNAYFGLLVAKETVRVNKALSQFTGEVYRFQERLAEVGTAAPYEPAALRAQAFAARLAYKQAIQSYVYAWKQLVAAVGLRQLPLSEVAGRIDAFIPYYDYDTVLNHVLRNHTDTLTAKNAIDKARYNLKLAQVTPLPDVDVRLAVLKEFALPPEKFVHTVQVGIPLPVWDQNKGAIFAAEASVVRATEEPHRVELNLTTNLATAYSSYTSSLAGLEYYRKYILPDQVRTYRGVFERRNVDFLGGVTFIDVVSAQQTLATSVGQYLTILGQVWTAVVSVADFLQTDDLFQLAESHQVPPLPDLDHLPPLPCCHPDPQHAAPGDHHPATPLGPNGGTPAQLPTLPPPTEIRRLPAAIDQAPKAP